VEEPREEPEEIEEEAAGEEAAEEEEPEEEPEPEADPKPVRLPSGGIDSGLNATYGSSTHAHACCLSRVVCVVASHTGRRLAPLAGEAVAGEGLAEAGGHEDAARAVAGGARAGDIVQAGAIPA
jgi:hypothetical protein